MRIYSAMAEPYDKGVIPKIEIIKFGITYSKLKYDEVYEHQPIEKLDLKKFISQKRALGILVIQKEIENLNGNVWLYSNLDGRLILSNHNKAENVEVKNILSDWSKKLSIPEGNYPRCSIKNPMFTGKTMEVLCELSKKQINMRHICNLCSKMKNVQIQDPILPEYEEEYVEIEKEEPGEEKNLEDVSTDDNNEKKKIRSVIVKET
nr:ORF V [Cassava vein mosaic virus]